MVLCTLLSSSLITLVYISPKLLHVVVAVLNISLNWFLIQFKVTNASKAETSKCMKFELISITYRNCMCSTQNYVTYIGRGHLHPKRILCHCECLDK